MIGRRNPKKCWRGKVASCLTYKFALATTTHTKNKKDRSNQRSPRCPDHFGPSVFFEARLKAVQARCHGAPWADGVPKCCPSISPAIVMLPSRLSGHRICQRSITVFVIRRDGSVSTQGGGSQHRAPNSASLTHWSLQAIISFDSGCHKQDIGEF